MPGSVICDVCGGKDFYNAAGFYYCNECQTQTQEMREQVFDQQDNTAHLRITKTTVRQNKSFSHVKLTSWEIFNHILYGLVEELNTLGVNKDFKEVCYHLWIHYLTKLEIMSKVPDGLPKLNACFRKRDAGIIFNRSFGRKRKKRTASASMVSSVYSSSNELDVKMIHKERAKQRRKLVRAEYEEYSNTNPSIETSIHNQTLSSLGSDTESVSSSGSLLVFSKAAKKELLKVMSREHLNRHINDTENEMKCHRFSQRILHRSYQNANVLTRNKLYAIIYIALLLTQDDLQLGDMIRYCREGHLSYLEYKHFFPDIMTDECIDESTYSRGTIALIASDRMRQQAWDIYNLLELPPCDISPNLAALCRRYCAALNLPDEVLNVAAGFIASTRPAFKTSAKSSSLPNYEGRAMAFIVFALKVLFGLDGATEYDLSHFARLINHKHKHKHTHKHTVEMFVFDDWFNYIQYRKLVLKNTHFPTKFLYEPNCRDSIDLYLKFMKQKKMTSDLDEAATLPMNIAKKYLGDLQIYQDNYSPGDDIDFQATLTPYRTYIDVIKNMANFTVDGIPINQPVLKDRSADSVNYILHHSQYLKLVKSSQCQTKQSGKNTNHAFSRIRKTNWDILSVHEQNWHRSFAKEKMETLHFDHLLAKILDKQVKNVENNIKPIEERLNKTEPIIRFVDKGQVAFKRKIGRNSLGRFCKKDSAENLGVDSFQRKHSKWFVSSWNENPLLKKRKVNPSLVYQVMRDVEEKLNDAGDERENAAVPSSTSSSSRRQCPYPAHYMPWLEHWVNVQEFNARTPAGKWDEFHGTLPRNFRWLLRECAAIIEQKPIDLFMEFVHVELYMCYVHVDNAPVLNKYCDNYKSITKIIQKVKSVW